ncbi:MAG: replication-relaxation family protein [Chloroflexota bacterium]|nr:replication-relaxation family protein [Chloroflexota bacterium]
MTFEIGSFGLTRVPSTVPLGEKHLEILRCLGRLEFALVPQIALLCFGGNATSTLYKQLGLLHRDGFIWQQSVDLQPHARGSKRVPERAPSAERERKAPLRPVNVYGLTPEGKALLESMAQEPDDASLAGLKTRDRRAPNVALPTLVHDLQASWWCAGVVAEARRNRLVNGIFVQVEYVSAANQRIDALVGLRIDPALPARSSEHIPWYDGQPLMGKQRWVWFALEVDRGTEPLKILMGKGLTYRRLTVDKTYEQTLGAPVIPVFLCPTRKRAAQIAREWLDAWPDGAGVAATPAEADHPEHGPLWGTYKQLIGGATTPLLPIQFDQWKRCMIPAVPGE